MSEILSLLANSTINLNRCLTNCSNRGKCSLNSQQNIYICVCNEIYFQGVQCELDIRPCSSRSQCLNNGTCENLLLNNEYSFECKCRNNFYGQFCEHRNSSFDKKLCSFNGRVYYDENEDLKCQCFVDYTGEKCEYANTMTKVIQYTRISSLTLLLICIGTFVILIVANDLFNYFILHPKRKKQKKIHNETSIIYRFKYYNQ